MQKYRNLNPTDYSGPEFVLQFSSEIVLQIIQVLDLSYNSVLQLLFIYFYFELLSLHSLSQMLTILA